MLKKYKARVNELFDFVESNVPSIRVVSAPLRANDYSFTIVRANPTSNFIWELEEFCREYSRKHKFGRNKFSRYFYDKLVEACSKGEAAYKKLEFEYDYDTLSTNLYEVIGSFFNETSSLNYKEHKIFDDKEFYERFNKIANRPIDAPLEQEFPFYG